MATSDIFSLFNTNELVTKKMLKDKTFDYLNKKTTQAIQHLYTAQGAINSSVEISNVDTDELNTTITLVSASQATDGLGHFFDINTSKSYCANVPLRALSENQTLDIALKYNEGPSYGVAGDVGIVSNSKTGVVQYTGTAEYIGEKGNPDAIALSGNDIILTVDTLCGSQNYGGRTCLLWLTTPQTTVEGVGIRTANIVFDGTNNKVTITSTKLGQSSPSTTVGDYQVLVLGPTVRDSNTQSLVGVSSYFYVGKGTSGTTASPNWVFQTTGQNVYDVNLDNINDEVSQINREIVVGDWRDQRPGRKQNPPVLVSSGSGASYGNNIYLFGGATHSNNSTITQAIQKYNVLTDTWETLVTTFPDAFVIGTTTIVVGNKAYTFGGKNTSNVVTTNVRIFNFATETFSSGTACSEAMYNGSWEITDNDGAIIFGYGLDGADVQITNNYKYTISSNTWASTSTIGKYAYRTMPLINQNEKLEFSFKSTNYNESPYVTVGTIYPYTPFGEARTSVTGLDKYTYTHPQYLEDKYNATYYFGGPINTALTGTAKTTCFRIINGGVNDKKIEMIASLPDSFSIGSIAIPIKKTAVWKTVYGTDKYGQPKTYRYTESWTLGFIIFGGKNAATATTVATGRVLYYDIALNTFTTVHAGSNAQYAPFSDAANSEFDIGYYGNSGNYVSDSVIVGRGLSAGSNVTTGVKISVSSSFSGPSDVSTDITCTFQSVSAETVLSPYVTKSKQEYMYSNLNLGLASDPTGGVFPEITIKNLEDETKNVTFRNLYPGLITNEYNFIVNNFIYRFCGVDKRTNTVINPTQNHNNDFSYCIDTNKIFRAKRNCFAFIETTNSKSGLTVINGFSTNDIHKTWSQSNATTSNALTSQLVEYLEIPYYGIKTYYLNQVDSSNTYKDTTLIVASGEDQFVYYKNRNVYGSSNVQKALPRWILLDDMGELIYYMPYKRASLDTTIGKSAYFTKSEPATTGSAVTILPFRNFYYSEQNKWLNIQNGKYINEATTFTGTDYDYIQAYNELKSNFDLYKYILTYDVDGKPNLIMTYDFSFNFDYQHLRFRNFNTGLVTRKMNIESTNSPLNVPQIIPIGKNQIYGDWIMSDNWNYSYAVLGDY